MRSVLFFDIWFGGLVAIVAVADPVFAQGQILPGPAPLIGVGLPIAGLVLAAVWLVRRLGRD
jgi:hypothetical protein